MTSKLEQATECNATRQAAGTKFNQQSIKVGWIGSLENDISVVLDGPVIPPDSLAEAGERAYQYRPVIGSTPGCPIEPRLSCDHRLQR